MKKLFLILCLASLNVFSQKEITDAESKRYIGVPNTGFTMIEFYSSSCQFSDTMKPVYQKLSAKYSYEAKFYKLNIDNHKDIYFVPSTPYYMVYKDEKRLITKGGVMDFNELETILLAGLNKDVVLNLIVASAKIEVDSKYLLFQAWNYMEKSLSSDSFLEKEDIGTEDIIGNAKKIEKLKNVENGLSPGLSITIGKVSYEIVTEPWKIPPPKDEPLFQDEMKKEYERAGGGTYVNDYSDNIWPKIKDGLVVKLSYFDKAMEMEITWYLCFGVDLNSGKFLPFAHVLGDLQ